MTKLFATSVFLFAAACTTPDEHVGTIASDINDDPGATTLTFRSPSGFDFQIRSVTPAGQPDPIYLCYTCLHGETTGKTGIFYGDVLTTDGSQADPQASAAAIVPLAALLVGLASTDQFTTATGLVLRPVRLEVPGDPPPYATAVAFVQQAAAYARFKEGTTAGALANSYLASLGIDSCSAGPGPKGL